MKTYIFIVTIFFISSVYGQAEKLVNIPTYKNYKKETDTSLWFKWKHDLAKQINLKDLQTSTDTFHFRFWTDYQAIDLWTTDHGSYVGMVTNYAERYDDKLLRKGVSKIGKVYSNQIILDSSKARLLFNIIDGLAIVNIPADDKINGWKQGFDGEEFLIETSSPKQYDFKTYWTPRAFADTLNEAKKIQTLVEYLYNNLKILSYYDKLKLPAGKYKRNGIPGIQIKSTNQGTTGSVTITDLL
ncbi:MAG: hypothetical protein QM791_02285 [Ferruginibacter sp.]